MQPRVYILLHGCTLLTIRELLGIEPLQVILEVLLKECRYTALLRCWGSRSSTGRRATTGWPLDCAASLPRAVSETPNLFGI